MDKGILSLLGLNCATWSERSRCENILTLGINDGPPPGPTKLRPDFPRAVRTLAAVQHEEGWMNSYIPKHFRERQRRIDDKGRMDLEWQCWNRNVKKQRVAGFFLFFDKIGGSQENGTSHKNGNGKDSKDGENGTNKYSLSESSVLLPDSYTFVVFSRSVA